MRYHEPSSFSTRSPARIRSTSSVRAAFERTRATRSCSIAISMARISRAGASGVANRGCVQKSGCGPWTATGAVSWKLETAEAGEQIGRREREVEMGAAVAEVLPSRQRYSIHRAGRTSPFAGAAALPRAEQVGCVRERLLEEPLLFASLRGRRGAWRGARMLHRFDARTPAIQKCLRAPDVGSEQLVDDFSLCRPAVKARGRIRARPAASAIAVASQVSCTSSRLMTY